MDDPKPVVRRALASQDVGDIVGHYVQENAQHAALAFIDALEDACYLVGRRPGIGTTRYAVELEMPVLRSWALPQFPCLIFYVEREDHIDVWRVLHGRSDAAREEALERWLRADVVASIEELNEHPERALSIHRFVSISPRGSPLSRPRGASEQRSRRNRP